jgi:hypothetical protein
MGDPSAMDHATEECVFPAIVVYERFSLRLHCGLQHQLQCERLLLRHSCKERRGHM